jgi:hypothetical protein
MALLEKRERNSKTEIEREVGFRPSRCPIRVRVRLVAASRVWFSYYI